MTILATLEEIQPVQIDEPIAAVLIQGYLEETQPAQDEDIAVARPSTATLGVREASTATLSVVKRSSATLTVRKAP